MMRSLLILSFLVHVIEAAEYGADVSFPIHHLDFHNDGPLGDRRAVYEDFMNGCRKFYGRHKCDSAEIVRVGRSLRQPQSMVNYTATGFMKIPAPPRVKELLDNYWEKNKDKRKLENWGSAYSFTNHWTSPTYKISVEDGNLRGGGTQLKIAIWDAAKSTIEQWTGMELQPVSIQGIRVYTKGAILNTHVDALPLVSSCIIHVAQDVDEPWPLEIYDRQGNAVNVTMEPGDMVMYESHSLIHGRPFALKGRFFANIFIHFEPTGRKIAGYENESIEHHDAFLPPYIIPGSPEVAVWSAEHPKGWKEWVPATADVETPKQGHAAAANGDIETLLELAENNRDLLHAKDENGWQPLHEAVRAGRFDAVKLLLEHDADINAQTDEGSSPLNVALVSLSDVHPVTIFLIENGAINIEPEL